jgi:hypothetical protein
MDMKSSQWVAPALLLISLASCGAGDRAGNKTGGESPVENAAITTFALTSEAFADGQAIPIQFTCDGADQPPTLTWSDPPEGTRSFALVVDDPDAPGGTFRHWAAYDIAAGARSLGGGLAQATNDFGKAGYGGPCPPRGHGPHRYRFKLLALDVDRLDVGPSPKVSTVETAAAEHLLGRAELTGTYERK